MRAEYELTRAEWDEANRAVVVSVRSWLERFSSAFPYLLCAGGAVLLLRRDEISPVLAPLLLMSLGLGLAINRVLGRYSALDRVWSESERLRDRVTVEADEEGLSYRARGWEVRYRWSTFLRFQETRNLLLLYQTRSFANPVIPKRAFESPEAFGAFREQVARHVSDTTTPTRGFPVESKPPPQ